VTERPRDAAGRPLRPGAAGVSAVHIDPAATPAITMAQADSLIAEGRPFSAHEVLEEAWKTRPAPERSLWRGLAQIAVGLTHLQRGNTIGGSRLLRRGAGELETVSPQGVETAGGAGVDVASLIAAATTLAETPRWPNELRLGRPDGTGSGGE
jgi:uncharacterized membrane-anchored protein